MNTERRLRRPLALLLTLTCWCSSTVAAEYAGSYATQQQNHTLTLQQAPDDNVSGIFQRGAQTFQVTLSPLDDKMVGAAQDADGTHYPLLAQLEQGTLYFKMYQADAQGNTIDSTGVQYDFERLQKLANTAPERGGRDAQSGSSDLSGNLRHPDGYFAMNVPPGWSAEMMSPDAFSLDTGHSNSITVVLMAELEPDEIGKPAAQIMNSAHEMVDGLLAENFGFSVDTGQAQVQLLQVGALPGGRSTRPARSPDGSTVTVWQGVVVDGKSAFVLFSVVRAQAGSNLVPTLDRALATVRLNRSWEISEFASRSGRRVRFNGTAIADEDLARVEGGIPVIPDGEYWYDARSGMAGRIGGPAEAYLAPGLNLGGPLAADASGGKGSVAFNGRYLHPIDLAGLQMYLGPINPGRYWIDGRGNYGAENGPRLGNLVDEIAAVQYLTAALEAHYQQQLNSAVQQYQGQGGGYYGRGGDYQQGGGGSVYSHFPNLGASGSSVSVADVGGGDTIVNAGGVLWWPGK